MNRAALGLGWLVVCIGGARADMTAQTDLASMTVTPLPHVASGTADWQTVYDYSGGAVLPPGTRLTANGKWIDPVVRKDASGVTFTFPNLPDQPSSAQGLDLVFADEQPIADYPTRATIRYTSYHDQAAHVASQWWSPFWLTTADYNFTVLSGQIRGLAPGSEADIPIHLTGENTMVISFDDKGNATSTVNEKDGSTFLRSGDRSLSANLPKPGAMLLPGLALRNKMTQLPSDKGDWFAVNAFKIEQMRPPLESSAAAAVDLVVPGTEAIRVTIEVVDDENESKGYVLRDALVSPGKYRLYWDGIDQKQSMPINTTAIGAGAYTFRLATGKTEVHYAGEMNNSVAKYNPLSYGMVGCTALALTPPGTVAQPEWDHRNYSVDSRKLDVTDSMQLLCIGYDSKEGQWVGADGTVIHTKTGDSRMQHGRGLAVTPPDAGDPTNPLAQFYFASMAIGRGDAVVSCSLPAGERLTTQKTLSSPDWNRAPAGFVPYKIHIGQVPYMPGAQHFLFFEMSLLNKGELPEAEWIFRNVRLYEEGSPESQAVVFDAARFMPRVRTGAKNAVTIPTGSLAIEDAGHSVHLKNGVSVNYPLEYTITPKTILAFDLNVVDKTHIGPTGNGIGLDSQAADDYPSYEGRFFNFLTGRDEGRFGFFEPSLGAHGYPFYEPNTLYTDTVPVPPPGAPRTSETALLWEPGYYGVKVSEDGKLLFACDNGDNRVEVRDISTDGGLVAKIAVNCPMYVTWAPEGAAGAPMGTRFVYVDSAVDGLMRIAWHLADNKFGAPKRLTPATEFAYPRGLVYDAVSKRLFVCDAFNFDRSKVANQIAVIDAQTGAVLSRFGRVGGIDPRTGGALDENSFSCPLTIEVDSKGALWVNDYYSCEVRKYAFDAGSNGFKLERRVLGPNTTNTSQFYWMPGDPPTRAWTVSQFFVRNDADVDADGRFTNQRATSATYNLTDEVLRPYAHFTKVGEHLYGVFYSDIFEQVGDGWVPRFKFGATAGDVARKAGLLARAGEPPTELDKAIAASGDAQWATRPWAWSDLDGDGKMSYSAANPEFQIAFNSDIKFDGYIPPTGCLRASDGAFVHTVKGGLVVITPKVVNGKTLYAWDGANVIPRTNPGAASDVLAQDGRFYTLTASAQRHDVGEKVVNTIECYDETGKLLWTRDQNDYSLVCLQSLGDGMLSIMDRGGWNTEGPVLIRTSDGDLVSQVFCREPGDCWSNGALRSDADTAYIGMVQAYKVTGLASVKTATVTAKLPAH